MRDSRLSIQTSARETRSESYLDRVLPNNLDMLTSVRRNCREVRIGSVVAFYLGAARVVNATGDNTSFQGSNERILISGAFVGGDSVDGDDNRIFLATITKSCRDHCRKWPQASN